MASALQIGAPPWVLIVLMIGFGVIVGVFVWAFIFFSYRSPDYLRSEKYTLTKLAIEHSQKGDNLVGLIGSNEYPRLPPPEQIGGK